MHHVLAALRPLLVAFFVLHAASTWAEDAPLVALDTSEDGHGWEAVGRLEIAGHGFCTGALIAPDLVLTAAHCLYDRDTGARIDGEDVEFRAGLRNGRALAYRTARRAVVHPDYVYGAPGDAGRVRNDVALIELSRAIRNTQITPFRTDIRPRQGARIGVVSYAEGRAEAPSLQDWCHVVARQKGVLVMSCDVDYGASGAPVFSFGPKGAVRIVSIVSAMAEAGGERVSLGTALEGPLDVLRVELAENRTFPLGAGASRKRIRVGDAHDGTGAKFVRP